MDFFLIAVIVLGSIGLIAAIVLYVCSKKFAVYEDPRIQQVNALLAGANCGGCGFAGCGGLAEALVKGADKGNIDGLNCPVGGVDTMTRVADLLGMAIANGESKIAVVRETGCGYGCLGCGDCIDACPFDAIHMNPDTNLPEVDEQKCTACGSCVKACPRTIIELRKKGVKGRRVFVSCVNKDKGAVAIKSCKAACIGCGKCAKACQFDAITLGNNVSYIDANKCRLCRKCVEACPTKAIHAVNFPERKSDVPVSVEQPEKTTLS